MNERWIVAVDQGTSSCRAFAVDAMGRVRAQKSKIFSPYRPKKGLSFYDAEQLLDVQLEVLNALLDEIGPEKAAALSVCSQRSTIVLWDKKSGQPLAPVLTWEDGRSQVQAEAAPLSQEEVHAQTGLFKTPYFSAPKIAWCLENCPLAKHAAQRGTLLVAPVASYLIWHLTNKSVFATDPTLAQRTLLWNIQQGEWSETLCTSFGIPSSCLPSIQSTVGNYGTYVYKGNSIPIYACVADQQAAIAYYALSSGQTVVNYGTGAFVLHHTGENLTILPGMLLSIAASQSRSERQFLLEGPIFSAGSMLEWLKTKGVNVPYERVDELAFSAKSPVLLLPALGGLGAPYWNYKVHAVADNVTSHTQPEDWIAGALNAIALRVADVIHYLHMNNFTIESMLVSGGLSRSTYLLQKQADIANVPLHRYSESESTILGAARLVAGFLAWDLTKWNILPTQTVFPQISADISQQIYHNWQQFVKHQCCS